MNLPENYRINKITSKLECLCKYCHNWFETDEIDEKYNCKECRYGKSVYSRQQTCYEKAKKLFDEDYPELRITLPSGKVEAECHECHIWFEINYFHDCARFLDSPNYCYDCAIKTRNKNSGIARHNNYIKYLAKLLENYPRYKLDFETELVWYKCDECDSWYIIDQSNLGVYLKQEKHYCPDCRESVRLKHSHETTFGKGICRECKKLVLKRYPSGRCKECHDKFNNELTKKNIASNKCTICKRTIDICGKLDATGRCSNCASEAGKEIRKEKYCEKCGSITPHNGIVCLNCHPESSGAAGRKNFIYLDVLYYKDEPVYKIIEKLELGEYNLKDFSGWNKRWCETCQKYEYHYETKCLICDTKNIIKRKLFYERNGIKYYKDIPVIDIVNGILNDEIDISNYPGWNIRFEHICYGTKDVLTGEKYIFTGSNFITVNNVEFILDHSTGQYELAKEFFKKLYNSINSIDPTDEVKNLINNEGFEIVPIIGDGVEKWNRAKTDKLLSDKGYGYFCYIKLLDGHPWICGKTGTLAVSKSYIDFDFKLYDEKNINNPDYAGPGRIFARRYYPYLEYSDFKFVLCKKCGSEQEALNLEDKIIKKYNLFAS